MSVEQNKRTAVQLLADISALNIDAVMQAMTDDASWWVAGSIPELSGDHSKEELAGLLGMMSATLMPDGLNLSVDHIIGEEDFLAVEGHSDALLSNGKKYSNQYHWVFEFRDGKVCNAKEYFDTLLVMQVGESMKG